MKKLKLFSIAIFAFTLSSQTVLAEENIYTLESNHTNVSWSANHFGFSNVTGKFTDVAGTITFDPKHPEQAVIDATIKINGLNTGIVKLDQHLKSKDFFDAEAFPTAKFVSRKVTVTGKNKGKVEGDLTIRGITKVVILQVKFNKVGVSPVSQKETVGFSATTTLNRSDFGIKYALPGVADKITLVIEAEANR